MSYDYRDRRSRERLGVGFDGIRGCHMTTEIGDPVRGWVWVR